MYVVNVQRPLRRLCTPLTWRGDRRARKTLPSVMPRRLLRSAMLSRIHRTISLNPRHVLRSAQGEA